MSLWRTWVMTICFFTKSREISCRVFLACHLFFLAQKPRRNIWSTPYMTYSFWEEKQHVIQRIISKFPQEHGGKLNCMTWNDMVTDGITTWYNNMVLHGITGWCRLSDLFKAPVRPRVLPTSCCSTNLEPCCNGKTNKQISPRNCDERWAFYIIQYMPNKGALGFWHITNRQHIVYCVHIAKYHIAHMISICMTPLYPFLHIRKLLTTNKNG